MKYKIEIDIDLPRERVIELFDNPDNLKKWQPDLVSFEHMSGEAGQAGAKSKLLYKMGKKEVEMVETITSRRLPDIFAGTYEAKGVWNSVSNRFEEAGPERTKWITDHEFKMSGFMKIMEITMPGMFKKQSRKYMEQFKTFAENEPAND